MFFDIILEESKTLSFFVAIALHATTLLLDYWIFIYRNRHQIHIVYYIFYIYYNIYKIKIKRLPKVAKIGMKM